MMAFHRNQFVPLRASRTGLVNRRAAIWDLLCDHFLYGTVSIHVRFNIRCGSEVQRENKYESPR